MMRSASWWVTEFLPRWLGRVATASGAVAELLGPDGRPDAAAPTTLTQARTVFALAHLHLATGDPDLLAAARRVHGFLDRSLRHPEGGYRRSTEYPIRRAYDQSFALLALTTLRRTDPEAVPASRVADLWRFVGGRLTESATGALWEDDAMAAGPVPADALRAQNPHMHMLEAVLQAREMTGEAVWLDRAAHLVALAKRHFIDPETGAVREFVGPDLEPLATEAGTRREPGHQYEWAWLLLRYADLGGDPAVRGPAHRMAAFTEAHGLRRDGPMAGAPFDAVDAAGRVTEDTHLLWPLTEAGKFHAATGAADRARDVGALIFERYFADGPDPVWVNRLDGAGRVVWPASLSRLVYHVALFVTEGARAGRWPLAEITNTRKRQEETTT